MGGTIFVQISLAILVVLAVSLIMRFLRQPLIIGYIISGIIAGPFFLGILPGIDAFQIFSEFGIAFLLFIVGLHLSPKVIKDVGKISLITGVGQIIFTALFGYFISIALGFAPITALYLSIALAFSSTIIILKLLSDKGDLDTLYGKISIGFLLVQDLVAIVALIIVSSISEGGNLVSHVGLILVKGIVLVSILAAISIYVLPKFQSFFARSQELLFVFSLAWGLGIASLFFYIGMSIEVGALLAGVLLSVSPYNYEISSRMKPLRDFFLISFFLLLGAQMILTNISQMLVPALVVSLFILVGNPLIVMSLMGANGYTKRTGFFSGLTVAQIGEFSLIFISLGVKVGHITPDVLSFVTMVSLITIAGSTYMFMYSQKLYSSLSGFLSFFQRKKIKEKKPKMQKFDTILFGYNRIGFGILKSLGKIKKKCLVVDYNPETISSLTKFGIPSLYGDVGDSDLLEELPLKKLKIVISTIPDLETNQLLIEKVRKVNPHAIIIVRAHKVQDAFDLYRGGASYVLTPHFLGGEYVSKMLRNYKGDTRSYKEEKTKHLDMLKGILERGHDHPDVEKN